MQKLIKLLTFLAALQGLLPFLKPHDRSQKTLLWLPKLMAGAFSPINALVCGLSAFYGLIRKDWKLTITGIIGFGLAAKFIEDVPDSQTQFENAFGSDWEQQIPNWIAPRMMPIRFSLPARIGDKAHLQQNLELWQYPKTDKAFLADLWQPDPETHKSGLGIIYAHGSGWRVGDKDLGTRPFFKHLASQGHTILDIAYTLWPEADLSTMVMEINQAILWMKENAPKLGINPEKIVLMGGSAGAHLSLLAAYAPKEKAFQSPDTEGNTSVCGVIAFYPPVDLVALQTPFAAYSEQSTPHFLEKAADGMMQAIFQLEPENQDGDNQPKPHFDMIAQMLGGRADQIPETYQLLSPIHHVNSQCPPTLLLHGADDVFDLTPGIRDLYTQLMKAQVPVVYVEFPHTEHAFDLMLPQISPVAQAALYDVDRFLAMLI